MIYNILERHREGRGRVFRGVVFFMSITCIRQFFWGRNKSTYCSDNLSHPQHTCGFIYSVWLCFYLRVISMGLWNSSVVGSSSAAIKWLQVNGEYSVGMEQHGEMLTCMTCLTCCTVTLHGRTGERKMGTWGVSLLPPLATFDPPQQLPLHLLETAHERNKNRLIPLKPLK